MDAWSRSVFVDNLDPILWTAGLGLSLFAIVYQTAKYQRLTIKYITLPRFRFKFPPKSQIEPGPATVVGTVSSPDGKSPIRVKIREAGKTTKGQYVWRESSRKVTARSFSLFVPSIQAHIEVQPDDAVQLRAQGQTTEWRQDDEGHELVRWRNADLEDGQQVIITGILAEENSTKIETEGYRNAKEKTQKRLVLRAAEGQSLIVTSENAIDEVAPLLGYVNWVNAIFLLASASSIQHAVDAHYTVGSMYLAAGVIILFFIVRMFMLKNRQPWFDRGLPPQKHWYREDIVLDRQ